MTKLSRKPISEEKLGYLINNVWSAFLAIDSRDEMRAFFRDLFTHTEYKMLAKRVEIARRLLEGEHYEEIIKQLNVSEKTISHVSNILAQHGEGFRKAHSNLKNLEEKSLKKRSEQPKSKFPRYKNSPHLTEIINALKN